MTLVLDDFFRLPDIRPHAIEIAVEEIDEAGIGSAKPRSGLHDLVEDRLKPEAGAAECSQDIGHSLLPATQVVQLSGQLGKPIGGGDVRHGTAE
jgi:hypothetical protein